MSDRNNFNFPPASLKVKIIFVALAISDEPVDERMDREGSLCYLLPLL